MSRKKKLIIPGVGPRDPRFLHNVNTLKTYPLPHMVSHGGLMPDTEEAAALWMFLVCAHQALQKIPTQATLEGEKDLEADLMQLAESQCKIYELDSMEKMFSTHYVDLARREAARAGLGWDSKLDAFFASGGKSYRFQERDPNKVGH